MLCLAYLLYDHISNKKDLKESEISIIQIQVNYQTRESIW